MNIIESYNATKFYGKHKALDNFTFEVKEASVFALLGPNGAGKTTFVKAMLGLTNLTSGHITISKINAPHPDSRNHLAYLPEKFNFFPYFSPLSTVKFFGRMNGLRGQELTQKANQVLEKVQVVEKTKTQKIKTLSKGQLQRLGMATLLMSDPQIFILDEPFSGLDPIGIKEMKDLFLEQKKEGKTVFINSHILSEVEKVCDEIAILHKGECLAQGQLSDMTSSKDLENFFYDTIKEQ